MHINFNRKNHGPAVADEWLAATAAATQFAIRVADREDIAVKLGPGFAAAAGTAMFSPALAEIEVDTDVMLHGVDPEEVHPGDELFRARHGLFVGSLVHEAAHAAHTRWVPRDLADVDFTRRKIDVLVALEESRAEKRILEDHPRYRSALGSIVFDLIGKDFTLSEDAYGASIGAALTLARVDSGSMTLTEAKPFRELVEAVLGEDVLNTLRGLWNEYHELEFLRFEPRPDEAMDSIATRWIEALGMDPSDDGDEGMACEFAMPGAGEDGEGGEDGAGGGGEGREGGSGGKDASGGSGGLDKAIKDAAKDAAHDKDMKDAEKVGEVKAKRRAKQREADQKRGKQGKAAHKDAFGDAKDPKPTGREAGAHGFTSTGGSTVTWRKPSDRERAAGVRLSRLLEKVVYSDRRVAKVRQQMPGGRLHGRGQVQRAAQRAAGQQAVADGWTVKKRTTVEEPKMRIGVMLDVSGSMSRQARLAGSLSYALGNAVERTGGDFSMTLFGSDVLGLVKTGQKLDVVPDIRTSCGWEYFSKAFYALDNELDLVDGEGLRVLVLLSDGVFVRDDEEKAADAIIPMLASKGVVVVHVDIGGELAKGQFAHYGPAHNNPYPELPMNSDMDPVDGAAMIGEHLIALVKRYKISGAA